MDAAAVEVRRFVETGAGAAGVEQDLVEESEAAGANGVEIHTAEEGGIPTAESAGGIAESDAGAEADEGGGEAADEQAVARPVFDEGVVLAVAGADDDIGVGEGGEELGEDGGIVGEVGVHGNDGIGAGAEGKLETGAHGMTVTARSGAFEDLDIREGAGGDGGAVGARVIDDQDLADGRLGGADGGDERGKVVAFIVGGNDDPHIWNRLHSPTYRNRGGGVNPGEAILSGCDSSWQFVSV